MSFKILFSDIDGTCVHYKDNVDWETREAPDQHEDGRLVEAKFGTDDRWTSALLLPTSTSGARGIISRRTLDLYAALRAAGVKVVLISGCRYSTLIQRLPCLPAADAYCCESGGRIFYPDTSIPTALQLKEDMAWRRSHIAAGPPSIADLPLDRWSSAGAVLWQQYQALQEAGLRLDAINYTTAFRVKVNSREWQQKYAASLMPGLSTAENLGAVDVYPSTSGKRQAARYLMERFGGDVSGEECRFMCDDDNDIELAKAVKKAYLPSITSESMRAAVENNPDKFYVATEQSVWATEEILQLLLKESQESQKSGTLLTKIKLLFNKVLPVNKE